MNSDFWERIRFFKPSEWKEDPSRAHPTLIRTLDGIRREAGVKVYPHVAFDTKGHAANSRHFIQPSGFAEAVDFHLDQDAGLPHWTQFIIVSSFREIGAIGWYPDWLNPGWHIDIRDRNPRVVWTRKKRRYLYGHKNLYESLNGE